MKHLDITVTGRVQGVFFRASTRDKARALGVRGWVSNQSDGSVFLEAEGSEEQLEDLVSWLQEGPEHARVQEVLCRDGQVKNYTGFSVR